MSRIYKKRNITEEYMVEQIMKLALAQLNPIIGDLDGNAEKIFEVCKEIINAHIYQSYLP